MKKVCVLLAALWLWAPGLRAAGVVAKAVSLVQLLATPERFEGERVEVKGFCRYAFEEHALYMNREDSDIVNVAGAVWLETGDAQYKDVNDTYVFVSGVFTTKGGGHLGGWGGVLREIKVLERTPTRSDLAKVREAGSKK